MLFLGLHLAFSGANAQDLTVVTVPPIAPYLPARILIRRTDEYDYSSYGKKVGEIHRLSDLKVTVWDKTKSNPLPEYNPHGQNETFLLQAPGDLHQARYMGYFTKMPREPVTLKFEYTRLAEQNYDTKRSSLSAATITAFTEPFNVISELTIPYFRPINDDKELNDMLEAFVREGVDRVNKNLYGPYPQRTLIPDYKVNLKTYTFSTQDRSNIMLVYKRMKKDLDTMPPVASILGIGSDDHALMAVPEMVRDGFAVTSFRKDVSKDFMNQEKFSYFNRLELPEDVFLDNVFRYLKQQRWTSIVIIQTTKDEFSKIRYTEYAERHGIDFTKVAIDGLKADQSLKNELEGIMASGRRIIVTTAEGNVAKNLFKEAMKYNMAASNGFQWVGLKNQKSLEFLDRNNEDWCIQNVGNKLKFCIEEFKGTIVLNNMLYHHYDTTEGEFHWRSWLDTDMMKASTKRKYLDESNFATLGVDLALAYDALKVNLMAYGRILQREELLSGKAVSMEIRETTIKGMSGDITLNAHGARTEFYGTVTTLWPIMSLVEREVFNKEARSDWENRLSTDWHLAIVFENKPNAVLATDTFVRKRVWSLRIIKLFQDAYDGQKMLDFKGLHTCQIPDIYWNPNYDPLPAVEVTDYSFNKFQMVYCQGKMRPDDQLIDAATLQYEVRDYRGYKPSIQMLPDFPEDYPKIDYNCTEETVQVKVIPSFFCEQGCGDVTDKGNVNANSNGVCVAQGKCRCKTTAGWSGYNCRDAFCDGRKNVCYNGGRCVAPDTCECPSGWSGKFCQQPVCDNCDAKGGNCTEPGKCECNTGYFGKSCSKQCTCVTENAGNNGKCHPSTGQCITCKSGYFSPSSDCKYNLYLMFGLCIAGGLVLVLLGWFLGKVYVRYVKTKQMMKNNDWILNWDDVKILDKSMSQRSSMMISAISMNANANMSRKQFNVGTYDGMEIYYQKLDKPSVEITPYMREEINAVRGLKHANICTIIGCSIEAPNVAIITELQPKGSLEDLFGNDDIKLPWNFKFGLIKGILAGLQFISDSPMKCHGRLKTSNCLVDNRWTIKLTGMGMKTFKAGTESSKSADYGSLLWTAPELIKSQKLNNLDHLHSPTISNDIYGLGVILSEFCTRDLPYSEVMLEKEDMINLITNHGDINEARKIWDEFLNEHNLETGGSVRPLIREHQWPKKYEIRKQLKALMEMCWFDEPIMRPTLADVKNAVEVMDPRKGELIEHLISMLEQYSTNLEHIVTKRTAQLEKESQRTEDLVSRLLPKQVSQTLKEGGIVEPENFEFTTIYFSDVVGFTSIARASTPFEVVAMLNNMYTLFDGIAGNHDVYKVETIGDAYMIVSGLPTRNGDLHAGEICTTALELMCAIGSFVVPHMPETKLRLRSGVHTGTVVAGVVGLKMPRYCLFGDSVNTASEMESGGVPSRIQISSKTQEILQRLGGYQTEYRDEIETAKAGVLGRYFLNGKDGFQGTMPNYDL